MAKTLTGKVCLVAGATRGAGRGIAVALGEAGAVVYCSGRSSRAFPGERPETIEETAERVSAVGGLGIAVRCDHTSETEVAALVARIVAEHGGLDVLVNDIWGGDELIEFGKPVSELNLDKGLQLLRSGVWTHIITTKHAAPHLRDGALVFEITDGDSFSYRGSLFFDLAKMAVIRLAWTWSIEIPKATALAITPGFLRSEAMLERFGVSEANWREGAKVDANFIASETPLFVGRCIAALAGDPEVRNRNGRVFSSWALAKDYGVVDADGSRPDWGEHFRQTYGREYAVADAAAYAAWSPSPMEIAYPDGFG